MSATSDLSQLVIRIGVVIKRSDRFEFVTYMYTHLFPPLFMCLCAFLVVLCAWFRIWCSMLLMVCDSCMLKGLCAISSLHAFTCFIYYSAETLTITYVMEQVVILMSIACCFVFICCFEIFKMIDWLLFAVHCLYMKHSEARERPSTPVYWRVLFDVVGMHSRG